MNEGGGGAKKRGKEGGGGGGVRYSEKVRRQGDREEDQIDRDVGREKKSGERKK